MATLAPNTTVATMLTMIPDCAISCVMNEVFTKGGCMPTSAGALSTCACTNITLQSSLSACVQRSCKFENQIQINSFASDLCRPFPKESRLGELRTISIVTIVLSIPFLILRLYSRWIKTHRWWSDDIYALTATVFLVTVSIMILQMSEMGFGLHYWDVDAENGPDLLKLFYVCQLLYVLVQVFSKVAILALYSRLFPGFIRWFQWSVRGLIAFMFIHGLVFLLLVVFQCLPINAIWDKTIEGRCLPISAVIGFTGAGLSIVEDFIILLLPIPELWRLQMSTRKKMGLIALFSVGSFASITSVIRLRYVLKYANTYDATWDNVDVIKWSLIEILSACICGNLLPLRPLIDKWMPGIYSVINWYSNRSSDSPSKMPFSFQKLTWSSRGGKVSEKPKLISTLNFSRLTMSTRTGEKEIEECGPISPMTDLPSHTVRENEHYASPELKSPQAVMKKPSTITLDRMYTATTESGRTNSHEGSERNLVSAGRDGKAAGRDRQRTVSGPWSRAWTVFDRR